MNSANNLLFRRQFILGTNESKNFDGWTKKIIGDKFFLYCHPELGIDYIKSGEKEITVLGYILDPFNPQYTNDVILEQIMQNSNSFNDVLACTEKYSGRWVLIWRDKSGVKIFNDACGTRQIYYYIDKNEVWCGSQPSIIAHELGLEPSLTPEIEEYIHSSEYRFECAWIGDGTIYDNLWHMLPNHFLDMELLEVKRFWPDMQELPELDMDTAVIETANIIRGTILSTWYRFKKIMLSVTAGLDSRMNLAASKPIKDEIKYFFCIETPDKQNTDFRISSQLLGKLHLEQDVIGLYEDNDKFTDIYNKNVTMASDLPSKRFIYSFHNELPDYIHVSGVGAGVARGFYNCDNTRVSSEKISKAAGYKNSRYVRGFIEKWLSDAEGIKKLKTINIYDIFYWEHRMGNWGAKSCAEQDIAIEETWPYNNRKLLITMLSVNAKYRKDPFCKFHRKVIKYLWEETLCMPVNPNLMKKVYSFVKGCPSSIQQTCNEWGNRVHKRHHSNIIIKN